MLMRQSEIISEVLNHSNSESKFAILYAWNQIHQQCSLAALSASMTKDKINYLMNFQANSLDTLFLSPNFCVEK